MNNEVINYWKAVAAKTGLNPDWNSLQVQAQMQVIESINLLLHVIGQLQHHQNNQG